MSDVDIFDRIPNRYSLVSSPTGEAIRFEVLSSLDELIRIHGTTTIHFAVRDTLLRLCETHILAHPKITRLIDLWDGIVGSVYERVERNIGEIIGKSPDPVLVEYVVRCLSGSASQRGRKTKSHNYYFEDVLGRLAASDGGRALRCECCGYHFRSKDLAQDRIRTVLDLGLQLEKSLFPGRSDDPYKPIQRGAADSLTKLSVDHVVPVETLGWSEGDNLEILCMFCNLGKMAFRRPLEAISSFAVGALAEVPKERSFGTLKHQIVVSALRSHGGVCACCAITKQETEITVRPTTPIDAQTLSGFAPWNLQTLCYPCAERMELSGPSKGPASVGDLSEAPLGVPPSEIIE